VIKAFHCLIGIENGFTKSDIIANG